MKLSYSFRYKATVFAIITGFYFLSGFSGFDPIIQKIINRFTKYHEVFEQQKAYLHTDKNIYNSGETIWIKGYLLNSEKNELDSLINKMTVQLINPQNTIIQTKYFKMSKGLGSGDFLLTDTVPAGIYQIRAYTGQMRNNSHDYFFTKTIKINNSKRIFTTRPLYKKAKSIKQNADDIDLQFFPEGGAMVDGLESKIAFKAVSRYGKGIDVNGRIIDNDNNEIAILKSTHAGMGTFTIKPAYKTKYKAIITDNTGKNHTYHLPPCLQKGYVMTVNYIQNDKINVTVRTNLPEYRDINANSVILLAGQGNKIYFSERKEFTKQVCSFEISKSLFPGGIVYLTLFSGTGEPKCERLIYADNYQNMIIQIKPDKSTYSIKSKVELEILTTSISGKPIPANLSVGVATLESLTETDNTNSNFLIHTLLSSDLHGKVENPEYYFKNSNNGTSLALDNLLLTQGWRKFSWKQILKDTVLNPLYPAERDIRISGRITKDFFDIPVKNVPVTITILNQYNDSYKQNTDKNGKYLFSNLNYTDTLDILLEARNKNGRKNIVIEYDEPAFPDIKFNSIYELNADLIASRGNDKTQPPYRKKEEPKDGNFRIYKEADNVLKFDDKSIYYNNVFDMLRGRVPGVTVTGNSVQIRGQNTFLGSTEPLYLLDGIPVDAATIGSINPSDVDKIEILKNPSNIALFGVRGANGVIAVYTKRGEFMKRGEVQFKMLGYCMQREFYSPKYDKSDNQIYDADNRVTLSWNPNVRTGSNGKTKLSFYTSDLTTGFKIIAEGISANGAIGTSEEKIEVLK